jgi:hypothetical protein
MYFYYPDADGPSGSRTPPIEFENQALKNEILILKDQTVRDEERVRSLSEVVNIKKTEAMEEKEKYECLEAQLSDAEKANRIANVSLKAADALYPKKCIMFRRREVKNYSLILLCSAGTLGSTNIFSRT